MGIVINSETVNHPQPQQKLSLDGYKKGLLQGIALSAIFAIALYFWFGTSLRHDKDLNETQIMAVRGELSKVKNELSSVKSQNTVYERQIQGSNEMGLTKAKLIPTIGWKTVSFVKREKSEFAGDQTYTVQMQIPQNWSLAEVNTRQASYGDISCSDAQLKDENGSPALLINPNCEAELEPRYTPITADTTEVVVHNRVGNDGHDDHTVRYFDTTKKEYLYGDISVQTNFSVDTKKDQISHNVIIHFSPPKLDLAVFTRINYTSAKDANRESTRMSIADTVVSTLKLVE